MSSKNHSRDRQVDQSAIKVSQAMIAACLLLAFVLDAVWLVAFVAAVMLLGTAVPSLSLFKQLYSRLLRPAGLVRPKVTLDNPEPHRFAQGLGGLVLLLALGAFGMGMMTGGWILSAMVALLAALNLFLGFCAGCFVYYHTNGLAFRLRHLHQCLRQKLHRLGHAGDVQPFRR